MQMKAPFDNTRLYTAGVARVGYKVSRAFGGDPWPSLAARVADVNLCHARYTASYR